MRRTWRPVLWWYIKRRRAGGSVPATALLTEAGAVLTTEGGDALILE